MEGPKTRRGAHIFKIPYWMYGVTRGQTWNGGHRFQMGVRAALAPRWRRPWCEQRSSTVTSEKSSTKPVRFCSPLIFVPINRCATLLASLFISFQTKWNKILCAALSDDPNAITQQKTPYPQFEKIVSKFDITNKRVFNVAGRMLLPDRCVVLTKDSKRCAINYNQHFKYYFLFNQNLPIWCTS